MAKNTQMQSQLVKQMQQKARQPTNSNPKKPSTDSGGVGTLDFATQQAAFKGGKGGTGDLPSGGTKDDVLVKTSSIDANWRRIVKANLDAALQAEIEGKVDKAREPEDEGKVLGISGGQVVAVPQSIGWIEY